MLQVTDIHAQVGNTPILHGITMNVEKGDFHLILGLNGSGKSTFGKVLLGSPQYEITGGKILFNEEDISEIPTFERAQKGIFLSHQSPPSLEGVSAKDVLRAADKAKEGKRSLLNFKRSLKDSLQKVGLQQSFLDRSLNDGASGGERKKMEIASLLTLGAKLAFLDEIDSGLDVDALKSVSQGIQNFIDQKDTAVILVSHSESILKYITPSYVHVFSEGKIIATGGMELAEKIHQDGYANIDKYTDS